MTIFIPMWLWIAGKILLYVMASLVAFLVMGCAYLGVLTMYAMVKK